MPMRLRDLTVTKVALVPKGANHGAHIVLFRHDPSVPGPGTASPADVPAPASPGEPDPVPVTRELAVFAGPGNTLPIRTAQDVTRAVNVILKKGAIHSTSRSRVFRRTVALAKAHGPAFEARLPAKWRVAKVTFTDVQTSYEEMEKKEEAWEAISTYMDSLRLAIGQTLFMEDGPVSDIDKSIGQFRDAVAAALTDISKE